MPYHIDRAADALGLRHGRRIDPDIVDHAWRHGFVFQRERIEERAVSVVQIEPHVELAGLRVVAAEVDVARARDAEVGRPVVRSGTSSIWLARPLPSGLPLSSLPKSVEYVGLYQPKSVSGRPWLALRLSSTTNCPDVSAVAVSGLPLGS